MNTSKMKIEETIGPSIHFGWFGLLFGVLYWLIESIRDVFVFNQGTIIERIFFPDAMGFWMRIMVVFIIILFSVRAQTIMRKMMDQKEDMTGWKMSTSMIRVGLGFGVLYWLLESFRDAFVFGRGSIIERIFNPEPMGFWMRLLAIFILLLISLYGQSIINTHKKIEAVLRKEQEKLKNDIIEKNKALAISQELLESERKQIKELEAELQASNKHTKIKRGTARVSVRYSPTKNRLYVTMDGELTVDDAERLKKAYGDALTQCKSGFDVITIAEGLVPFNTDVQHVFTDICILVSKFGVNRVVRVVGDTPRGAMQLNLLSRSAGGYVATNFKTLDEAEKFLDS